jgi:hypothetical protein
MERGVSHEPARVECHSGYTYGERPIAFTLEGRRYGVASIEDRRRLPEGIAFRVRTHDGEVFDLLYDSLNDVWLIQQP